MDELNHLINVALPNAGNDADAVVADILQRLPPLLESANNTAARWRPLLHNLVTMVGPTYEPLRQIWLDYLLSATTATDLEWDVVLLVLDCLLNDQDNVPSVMGPLMALCQKDCRLALPVWQRLSQFPSCRRRCVDFIRHPVLEEDTLELIRGVLGLLQTKEEAVAVLQLVADEGCQFEAEEEEDDEADEALEKKVYPLAAIVVSALRDASERGAMLRQTYGGILEGTDEGSLSCLDLLVLLMFPEMGEPMFRDLLQRCVLPFDILERVLRSYPSHSGSIQIDTTRWILFFLAHLSTCNHDETLENQVPFFLHWVHCVRSGSKRRDALRILLKFADQATSSQPTVYALLLRIYRDEPEEVQGFWPLFVDRMIGMRDESDHLHPDALESLCILLVGMASDGPSTRVSELCSLLSDRLLYSTPHDVVHGIRLATECYRNGVEIWNPNIGRDILKILLPPTRRTVHPDVALAGLHFVSAACHEDRFEHFKLMIANAGLVQTCDNRRDDETWFLGFADIDNYKNNSQLGRRMVFSPKILIQQQQVSSKLDTACSWVHHVIHEYILLGSQQVPSWCPEGWLLSAIELPSITFKYPPLKRLRRWIDVHLTSFESIPSPHQWPANESLVDSLVNSMRTERHVEEMFNSIQTFGVGLLLSLSFTTAVVKTVVDNLTIGDDVPGSVEFQLLKLYDLETKVAHLHYLVLEMQKALAQKLSKLRQSNHDNMLSDDDEDNGATHIVSIKQESCPICFSALQPSVGSRNWSTTSKYLSSNRQRKYGHSRCFSPSRHFGISFLLGAVTLCSRPKILEVRMKLTGICILLVDWPGKLQARSRMDRSPPIFQLRKC